MADPNIRIKRSSVPGKRPTIEQLSSGELALNTHDGEIFIRRERTGVGTDIVRVSAGTTVTNIIYVTKDGNDTNTGKKLGDAKATIKNAVENAPEGSIIKVSAGIYEENNPIIIPKQVSIVGESLREVSVKPLNEDDLFRVSNGNYITGMSFIGVSTTGNISVVAFDRDKPQFINQSPYIQNCTNFIDNSIGLKIDGRHAIGPTKSMVLDSFTQYNPNGIGASITNGAYAQLVSMFTICTDKAVYCGSGGGCDLTNSNSSFGNYGLVSDGVGALQYKVMPIDSYLENTNVFTFNFNDQSVPITSAFYTKETGKLVVGTATTHKFTVGMAVTMTGLGFTCSSGPGIVTYPSGNNGYVFDVSEVINDKTFSTHVGISTLDHTYVSGGTVEPYFVRPYDGQVLYIGDIYYELLSIKIIDPGSEYVSTPSITFDAPPNGWGVSPQATAEIIDGKIASIEIVSNGRGYTEAPNISVSSPGGSGTTAVLQSIMTPKYYSVLSSTPISSGICTVTLNESIPYALGIGDTTYFFKQSRLLASGHSFEYIGSGTDIDYAIPTNGGVPVQENEVITLNGGSVVYTSTDHSGNFRIGDGVVINQTTGTISGTFYSKSLFSTMTPFILALGGE
jgi:hypothetical protein